MNEAVNVGNWIAAATSVGSFLLIILKVSGRTEKREITPNPLIVKPEPEFAPKEHIHHQYITKDDCREAHLQASKLETLKLEPIQKQLDYMLHTFQATLTQHNQQAEERAAKLHSRIDPISDIAKSTDARLNDHLHGRTPHVN